MRLFLIFLCFLATITANGVIAAYGNTVSNIEVQLQIYENVIDSIESKLPSLSHEKLVDALVDLSKQYSSVSPEKSLKYAQDAVVLAENISYQKGKIKAYNAVGQINLLSGVCVTAMEYFFKAMSIAQSENSISDIAYAMDKIGDCYRWIPDLKSAMSYYNNALQAYRKLKYTQGISLSLAHIGICYGMQHNCEEALKYYNEALEIAQYNNYKAEMITIFKGIGNCYGIIGEYEKSLDYYDRSLKIAVTENYANEVALLHNNIGNTYRLKSDYENACRYTAKGYDLAKDLSYKEMMSMTLCNLGGIAMQQKQYGKAKEYLEQSHKIAKEIKYEYLQINALNNYILLYCALNRYDKASYYQEELIKVQSEQQKVNNVASIANLQILYDFAGKEQQLREAQINKLKSHLVLAIIIVLLILVSVFFFVRFRITRKQNFLQKKEHGLKLQALEQEKDKHRLLEQQVALERKKHEIDLEKLAVEKQQSDMQLEQVTLEKKLADIKLEQTTLEKQSFEMKLDSKNRELVSTTMQTLQKNEILNNLRNKIEGLKEKHSQETVNEITRIIDNSILVEKSWDTFLLHFTDVHPEFFDKLQKKYPDLSEKDIKHCAYIKIGLSLKEVAFLMNVSVRAVEKARMKLRLKMDSDENSNLFVLLQSL